MKKGILLFFLLSIGLIADDAIVSELKSLNSEYEILVQEEEIRFQKEKELSERAAAQNVKLAELKANIEEKLLAAPEERKTKFFKDTFDGLVKDYSKYLNQINEKIAENNEIVSNFEKIQKIR
ncbi:adhesion protein FadA [Fusobacterium sp. oral taxon 370 str. F0437]|uniref:adhesion protein FadA n=1 Tax=Fusobacterium sp. oral taxon 370 TaxID=712288 RepID=UPI000234ADB2|nr:adhesion protein FadA [Fusobacterium sp. oral taxon 370]EHI77534.1 adhesion protein FadA [Fusobacterium sp. oral taxon 370 str. F0437]